MSTCPEANEGDTTDKRWYVLGNSRDNAPDDRKPGPGDKKPSATEILLDQMRSEEKECLPEEITHPSHQQQ